MVDGMRIRSKYVRLDRIKAQNAQYNILYGKRSNGKSYAVQEEIVDNFLKDRSAGAVIRRYEEDYKGKRAATYFDNLSCNEDGKNVIKEKTGGEWDRIVYDSGRWYLGKYADDLARVVRAEIPLAYKFALTSMEHDKSSSYPSVRTVVFEEFMSRGEYLDDEFIVFCNTLSTIIRNRNDVKIYMLANSVDMFCPYIDEMGLTSFREMHPGDLAVYNYGESGLRVAVEYTDTIRKDKGSDVYFAFDNPKLKMITDGSWELPQHPHAPEKIKPEMIHFRFYIKYSDRTLQANVVNGTDGAYIYVHPKTSPFKEDRNDLIYTDDPSPSPYIRKSFRSPAFPAEEKILRLVRYGKVFFSDNPTGEAFYRFCEHNRIA